MTWPWYHHARAPTEGTPASRLTSGTPGKPRKLCGGGRTYPDFPDEPPATPRRWCWFRAQDDGPGAGWLRYRWGQNWFGGAEDIAPRPTVPPLVLGVLSLPG